ncbi:MAG: lytic transglycosylase domain-containing protein [Halomonas sp.]|nr:lytic transglycosylase domain-containing protein [Halomonas sp.]MCD6437308.1 lytic transglycosylase domain-containing protein [Halomonas sp.]
MDKIPARLEARIEYYYPIFKQIINEEWGQLDEVASGNVNLTELTKIILAQAIAESSLDAEAVGHVIPEQGRAIGIMQLMPTTFQFIAETIEPKCENIWNIEDNIRAGVAYDRWLYVRLRKVMPNLLWQELMKWVFAEYNWRLGLWEKFGKVEQTLPMNELPDETYEYICRIEDYYYMLQDMKLE